MNESEREPVSDGRPKGVEKIANMQVDVLGVQRSYYELHREALRDAVATLPPPAVVEALRRMKDAVQKEDGMFDTYSDWVRVLETLQSLFSLRDHDRVLENMAKSPARLEPFLNVLVRDTTILDAGDLPKVHEAALQLAMTIERLAMHRFPEAVDAITAAHGRRDAKEIDEKKRRLGGMNVS